MFDREFEEFLLEQVRREGATYYGVMITFGCCAAACIVMGVASVIVFGEVSAGTLLKLLIMLLPFAGACYGARSVARARKEAAEEMAYALKSPECSIPDDYMDETKAARQSACKNLRSIRGLIISYSILAVMLWAVTVLLAYIVIATDYHRLMMLFLAFVVLSMALGLTILAAAYIRDLPRARKYRKFTDRSAEE